MLDASDADFKHIFLRQIEVGPNRPVRANEWSSQSVSTHGTFLYYQLGGGPMLLSITNQRSTTSPVQIPTRHLTRPHGPDSWEFHKTLEEDFNAVVKIHGLLGDLQLYVFDPAALHSIVVKD
ncbi:hypothetical protein B0H17DRAFT_1209677 [Mycena rosella]|uniref:Uncharacterized protein n=1 Tax=Mycena rosella TaxID=1033263 RepID=A0AAD7CY06_MYCRO|nr:hypothetical protein B0H17DRAFT_1209677 [Mycena rosella]